MCCVTVSSGSLSLAWVKAAKQVLNTPMNRVSPGMWQMLDGGTVVGLGPSGSSGLFEVLECHMGWGRVTGTARGHVFPLTWRPTQQMQTVPRFWLLTCLEMPAMFKTLVRQAWSMEGQSVAGFSSASWVSPELYLG